MILISLSDEVYASSLEKELKKYNSIVHRYPSDQLSRMIQTLGEDFTCVVVDHKSDYVNQEVWVELLKTWARSAKVFVYPNQDSSKKFLQSGEVQSDRLMSISDEEAKLYTEITSSPAVLAQYICNDFSAGPSWFFRGQTSSMPFKHLEVMLREHKILYLFYVDGSKHRNIYTEYGVKVHAEFHRAFEKALYSAMESSPLILGKPAIYKKDKDSNIYYIFCAPEHFKKGLPQNKNLVQGCYQIYISIDQQLRKQLSGNSLFKDLLYFPKKVASFSVGYSSLLYNRCFSMKDQIRSATSRARVNSRWLNHQMESHERDLLVNLMNREGLLYTRHQAIFEIQDFGDKEIAMVESGHYHKLIDKIYGFESLIGVDSEKVHDYLGDMLSHVDPKSLNPGTLFSMACRNNLSLELDQKCISLALKSGSVLPGTLLINIFPRNFYYVEKLSASLPSHMKIIFELSEDKVIKNSEYILEAKSKLNEFNIKVATDDVSSGFSNLQRLMRIQPDLIKLDRGLIGDMDTDLKKQSIVKTFVEYARSFNHKIMAEGVETRGEFDLCRKLGIDYIQGFFLHKPCKTSLVVRQFGLHRAEERQRFVVKSQSSALTSSDAALKSGTN